MRRRDFIALLFGCTTITRAPRIASAQQSSKLPTIGYLGGASSLESDWIAAFAGRFGELGWVERGTVTIDVRGRKATRSALPRSRPSSSGESSTSSSLMEAQLPPYGVPAWLARGGDLRLPVEQLDFAAATLHFRRVKNGKPSTHPIRGDELRALLKLHREAPK